MFISVISPYFPYSIVVPLNFPFKEIKEKPLRIQAIFDDFYEFWKLLKIFESRKSPYRSKTYFEITFLSFSYIPRLYLCKS